MQTWIMTIAAFFGLTSVVLGAFAAHGLKNKLDDAMLNVFHTATQYQMTHALALLFCGLYYAQVEQSIALKLANLVGGSSNPTLFWIKASALSFIAGIVLFSGSLYGLSLSGQKWLGPITPIGGLLMILGWAFLITAFLKN
ncbi:MAG: DUF423 domain-containing protein [Enterobacterales bacterium]|nr:DUF423 domain-containing protein [Enterobacterales bacterium]